MQGIRKPTNSSGEYQKTKQRGAAAVAARIIFELDIDRRMAGAIEANKTQVAVSAGNSRTARAELVVSFVLRIRRKAGDSIGKLPEIIESRINRSRASETAVCRANLDSYVILVGIDDPDGQSRLRR